MVKLKLCGITRAEDYFLAGELGIDFAGFVFVPDSPRCVSPELVEKIVSSNPGPSSPVPVGVFGDQSVSELRRIISIAGLAVAQLHGGESLSFCRKLPVDFWKAVTSEDDLKRYPESFCSTVVLDASGIDRTGALLDEALAARVLATGRRAILAGGLSGENIEGFLELKPWGVDFSSSVERSPGVKDHGMLRTLVEKIRRFHNE